MPIIEKQCPQCGAEFSGPNFAMKKRKFCSHGCYAASNTENFAGKRFGRLTVVSRAEGKRWLSICDCGRTATPTAQNLTSGKSKSCGCLSREMASSLKRTHGASNTPAHNTWSGMIQRCTNPNTKQYSDYGGRGITVCEEWRDFSAFLRDMGQPPNGYTIERKDNDKGYNKENCIWADRKTQQRNRRIMKKISHNGENRCLSEWAEIYGVERDLVMSRIFNLKWTFEEAVGLATRIRPKGYRASSSNRMVTYDGRTQHLEAWCRELGINSKTVHSRISRGASVLEALRLT